MRLTRYLTLALCVAAASCAGSDPSGPEDSSRDAGSPGSGGAGGSTGGGGGAGAGGGPATRTCARIGSGCSCYEGPPGATDPSCGTTSVVLGGGDVGACCQ